MSAEARAHRSYLYVPGSSPHRFENAQRSGADAVLLDLEDAVAAIAKDGARSNISEYARHASYDGAELHVRINHPGSEHLDVDLEAAVWPTVSTLRVPKVESADDVRLLDDRLMRREQERGIEVGRTRLTLIIESAIGALRVSEAIAASDRVSSVAFGSSDFLADIGAIGDDDAATLHVRSQLVLVCRAQACLPPIDSVTTVVDDAEAVLRAASFARGLGFFGKSLIHPRQIAPAHEVFTPTAAEIERAESVIAGADAAAAAGIAAISKNGEFIDPAIVARSRALLAIRRTNT